MRTPKFHIALGFCAVLAGTTGALADPGLYGRDPAGFAKLSGKLDALRRDGEAREMEWLELEGRRETLAGK